LFAVDPKRQSNGVGSMLMRAIIDYAQQQWMVDRAVVWVLQQRTPLIAWYERMGFADTGKTRDFVRPDKAMRPTETWFKILEKTLA
jgi:ribosomal protein S18 acetylase RimI-like enzyme